MKKTSEKKLVKEVKKKEEAPKMNPSNFSKEVFSTLHLKSSNKGLDLVQNMEKEVGLQFLQPDDLKISKNEKKNKGLKGGAPPQKMYQKEKRPIKVPLNLRSIDEQIKYTESQLSKLPKKYSGAQLRKSLEIKLDQLKKQKVPKENLASDFSNMYKLMDNNVRSPESSVCCEDTSSVAPNDLAESLPSPTKKRSSPKSIFCSPGSTCTIMTKNYLVDEKDPSKQQSQTVQPIYNPDEFNFPELPMKKGTHVPPNDSSILIKPHYKGNEKQQIVEPDVINSSAEKDPSILSLLNNGNQCYGTATLFSLFFSEEFRDKVKETVDSSTLSAILHELKKSQNSDNSLLNLATALDPSFTELDEFGQTCQQDAAEFVGFLLEVLNFELTRSERSKKWSCSSCPETWKEKERTHHYRVAPSREGVNKMQDLVDQLVNDVEVERPCQICDPITPMEKKGKIQRRMKKMIEETTIHNNPKVLIIQVGRNLEGTNEKINTKIEESNNIKLGRSTYQLFSFVEHQGSDINSGHYISFAKNESLWKFDDSLNPRVEEITIKTFEDSQRRGYIYFYKRFDVSNSGDVLSPLRNR